MSKQSKIWQTYFRAVSYFFYLGSNKLSEEETKEIINSNQHKCSCSLCPLNNNKQEVSTKVKEEKLSASPKPQDKSLNSNNNGNVQLDLNQCGAVEGGGLDPNIVENVCAQDFKCMSGAAPELSVIRGYPNKTAVASIEDDTEASPKQSMCTQKDCSESLHVFFGCTTLKSPCGDKLSTRKTPKEQCVCTNIKNPSSDLLVGSKTSCSCEGICECGDDSNPRPEMEISKFFLGVVRSTVFF